MAAKAESKKIAGPCALQFRVRKTAEVYATLFRRRRAKARRQLHAAIRPGKPAPTIGPGTATALACRTSGNPLAAEYHRSYVPGPTLLIVVSSAVVGEDAPGIRLVVV